MQSPRSSRRDFLRHSLAGACAAVAPPLAAAPAADAHERAADAASRLAAGHSVTLKLLLPQGSESNVLPIANQFEARTGIGVHLETTSVEDINTVLMLSRLTGKRRFDVALPATYGVPDLAEAGALTPLDGFAKRHEPHDYQADSLYSIGDYYLGRLYGYQADGDVYLMFYNAAFLKDAAAGKRYADRYAEPLKLPRTWAELDRQLEFFHEPEKGRYGGALFRTPRYIAWEYWMRLHSKGVLPFDEAMRPQIAGDAGIEALQELTAATRFLSPDCRTNSLFQNWQAFATGNMFCNVGWGGSQKYFRQHPRNFSDGIVYSHAPGSGGRHQGTVSFFNWGWNYAVPSGSRHPEIAYLFTLFASSPAMSTLAVRQPDGFFDPIRETHYDDPEIRRVYSPEFLAAHHSAMRSAVPDLYLRGQSEYFEILSDYLLQADRLLVSPSDALAAVAKLWDDTTNRLGRDEQVRQWRALRRRYPPITATAG